MADINAQLSQLAHLSHSSIPSRRDHINEYLGLLKRWGSAAAKESAGRGGGRGGGKHQNPRRMRPDIRDEVEKSNWRYEKYYENLDILPDGERKEFWDTLRRELPNSFRFTGSRGQALPVQQLLKDRYIPEISSIEYNGEHITPPTPIPWYPDQLAWQMTTPKSIVRKFPAFAAFQKFLVNETSVGNISRQEAVSMIPPLLMDLRPSMTVLDMCAAPGSKAVQLIEMVHGGEEARVRAVTRRTSEKEGWEPSPEGEVVELNLEQEEHVGDWSDDGRATGLVIANDKDYKRAHMLTHQVKRLNSPNLIVTNHDATMFPSIKIPSDQGPNKYLKLDRILADVPCSGDGTCRKNVNVWKDWTPGNALGLFFTQQRILVRALQMLKVGGRVVYSTCSMNPVENEAVIASAIDRCGGLANVKVIDCSSYLPDLKRKPGLWDWKVMDKSGDIWSKWEDFEAHQADERLGKLAQGMFPPTEMTIPLDRCMRIYPHLQDTGGFFIAVLEKTSEIRARPEAEPKETESHAGSILNVAKEIEKQPMTTGGNPTPKIDALDSMVPPSTEGVEENVAAAARQNKENAPSTSVSSTKRSLDAEADALMAAKRPKVRDGVDPPAPEGSDDRLVHFPPPPGAALDASRPEYDVMKGASTTTPLDPTLRPSDARLPKRHNQPYEEPFKYLPPNHEDLESISNFYALSPRFPRDRFMVRNALGTATKTIYYTSRLARDILTSNTASGIKFVHCGVKMFVRQDVQGVGVCRWRIQSEGLPLLEAWVGEERVVKLWRRSTLRGLLVEMFPKIEGEGWEALGEIAKRVRGIGMGCCVLRVEKREAESEEDGFRERMVLPLWRSLHSLNLMLPKEERSAMLLRLYGEDTPLQDHSKERFTKQRKPEGKGTGKDGEVVLKMVEAADEGEEQRGEEEARVRLNVLAEGDEADIAPTASGGEDELMSEDEQGGGVPLKEDDIEASGPLRQE